MAGRRPQLSTGGPLEEGVAPKVGGVGGSGGAHFGGMPEEGEGGEGGPAVRPTAPASAPSEGGDEDRSTHEHKPKHPSSSDLRNPIFLSPDEAAKRGMAYKAGSGAAATSAIKMDNKPGAKTSRPPRAPKGESHDSSQTSGPGERAPKGRETQRGQRGSGNKATSQREEGARSQQTRGFETVTHEGEEPYIADRKGRMLISEDALKNALHEQQNGNPVPLQDLREGMASTNPGGMTKEQAGRLFDNLTREYAGAQGKNVSSLTTENAAPATVAPASGSASTSTGGGERGKTSVVETSPVEGDGTYQASPADKTAQTPPVTEKKESAPPVEAGEQRVSPAKEVQTPPVETERAPEVVNSEGGHGEDPHAAALKNFAEKTGVSESEAQALKQHLDEGTINPKDLDTIAQGLSAEKSSLKDLGMDESHASNGLRSNLQDLNEGNIKVNEFLDRQGVPTYSSSATPGEETGLSTPSQPHEIVFSNAPQSSANQGEPAEPKTSTSEAPLEQKTLNSEGVANGESLSAQQAAALKNFAEKTGLSESEAQVLAPYLQSGQLTPEQVNNMGANYANRVSSMKAWEAKEEALNLNKNLQKLSDYGRIDTFARHYSADYQPATSSATAPASASNAAPSASSSSGNPPPPNNGGNPPPPPTNGSNPPPPPPPGAVTLTPPPDDPHGRPPSMPMSLRGRFNQSDYKGEWKDSNGAFGGPKYHRFEHFTVIEESNGNLKVAPPIQVQKNGLGQTEGQINASKSVDLNKLDATKGDLHQYVALRNDLQGQGWDVKQVDAMAQGYFSSLSQSARGGVNTLKLNDLPLHKDLQGTFRREQCSKVELTNDGTIRYHMENSQGKFVIETTVDRNGNPAPYTIKDTNNRASMTLNEFNSAKGNVFNYARTRDTQTNASPKEFEDLYKSTYEALGNKNNSLVHPDNLHQHLPLPSELSSVDRNNYKSATITYNSDGTFTVKQNVESSGRTAQVVTTRDASGNVTRADVHDANGKYVMSLDEYNQLKGDFRAFLQKRQEFVNGGGDYQQFDNSVQALNTSQRGQRLLNLDNLKNLRESFPELNAQLNGGANCTGVTLTKDGAVFQIENGGKTFYIHSKVDDASGKPQFEVRDKADGSGFKVNLEEFNEAKSNVYKYIDMRERHAPGNNDQFDEFSKGVVPSLKGDPKSFVNLEEFHKNFPLPPQVNIHLNSNDYTNATATPNGDGTYTVTQTISNSNGEATIVTRRDANGNVFDRDSYISDRSGRLQIMSLDEYQQVKGDFKTFLQKRQDYIAGGGDYRHYDSAVTALNSAQGRDPNVWTLGNLRDLNRTLPELSAQLNGGAKCTGVTLTKDGAVYQIENGGKEFYVKTAVDASGKPNFEVRDKADGSGFKVNMDDFNKIKDNVYAYMRIRNTHAVGAGRTNQEFDEFSKSVFPSLKGDQRSFVNLEEFHLNFPLPPQVNIPINSADYTNATATPNGDGTYTVTQTVSNSSGDATVVTRRDANGNIVDRDSYISDGSGRMRIMSLDEYSAVKNNLGAYLAVRHGFPSFMRRGVDQRVQVLNKAHRNQRDVLDLNNLDPQRSFPSDLKTLDARQCQSVRLTDDGVEYTMQNGHGTYQIVSEPNGTGGFTHSVVDPATGRSINQSDLDRVRGNIIDYLNGYERQATPPHERAAFDDLARRYYSSYQDRRGVVDIDNPMRSDPQVGTRNGQLNARACYMSEVREDSVDFHYHSGMGNVVVSVDRTGRATISPENGRFSVPQNRMDEALRSGQSYRNLRDEIANTHGVSHDDFDNFSRAYSSIHSDRNGRINLSDTSRKALRKAEIMVDGKYGGAGGGHHQKMHHLLIFHAINSLSHDYFALKKEELTGAVKIAETAAH